MRASQISIRYFAYDLSEMQRGSENVISCIGMPCLFVCQIFAQIFSVIIVILYFLSI